MKKQINVRFKFMRLNSKITRELYYIQKITKFKNNWRTLLYTQSYERVLMGWILKFRPRKTKK